jgi:hypothetical protein
MAVWFEPMKVGGDWLRFSKWKTEVEDLCKELKSEYAKLSRGVKATRKRVEKLAYGLGLSMAKFQRVKSARERMKSFIVKLEKEEGDMYEWFDTWNELVRTIQGYVRQMRRGEVKGYGRVQETEMFLEILQTLDLAPELKTQVEGVQGYIDGVLDFAETWFTEHKELEEMITEFNEGRRELEKKRDEGGVKTAGHTDQEVA